MSASRKIADLQALRAIAAGTVIVAHAIEYGVRRQILDPEGYRVAWSIGWLGVTSFFTISGLIMIRSSYDRYGCAGASVDFLKRRLLRVVPLYWLVMLPMAAATLLRGEPVEPAMILKTMLFIPYLPPGGEAMRPVVGQGWTLNFEMMFYALFALTLLLRRRVGILLLIGWIAAVVAARAFVWPLVPYADPSTPLQFWTDPLLLMFAGGVLVGWAERSGRWRPHRVAYPVAATLALFAATTSAFVFLGGSFPMPIGWQAVMAFAGLAAVVLCAGPRDTDSTRLGAVMERLGDASYSTYLVHPLVLMVLAAMVQRVSPALFHPAVFVPVALVACNLAGWVMFRTIELPLTRWLNARAGIGAKARPADMPTESPLDRPAYARP